MAKFAVRNQVHDHSQRVAKEQTKNIVDGFDILAGSICDALNLSLEHIRDCGFRIEMSVDIISGEDVSRGMICAGSTESTSEEERREREPPEERNAEPAYVERDLNFQ